MSYDTKFGDVVACRSFHRQIWRQVSGPRPGKQRLFFYMLVATRSSHRNAYPLPGVPSTVTYYSVEADAGETAAVAFT